jgi:predicted subunit of tRNA(5-methylaminomethyl-2-thiouridylate) methyltransferase
VSLALLHSGGTDSTLAALLLDPFYDVTLVTATAGVTDDHRHARPAADALGLPRETASLDRAVFEDAVEEMVADGYPRNGIQRVHEHALETVAAGDWDAVADGTRRDDRAPTLSRAAAQSLEDRHGVDYVRPLAGFGRGAVDRLAAAHLTVECGPSEGLARADYEAELRALLAADRGGAAVERVFPEHVQSRVTDVRRPARVAPTRAADPGAEADR